MGFYTDYIIECDSLAFNRMLNEWKEKRGEFETELPRPHFVWENAETDSLNDEGEMDTNHRYMIYYCINHGPYANDVFDWMYVGLGLDERHFTLKVKTESDKEWETYGELTSLDGYKEKEYEMENGKLKGAIVPEGWLEYEYCYVIVDSKIWTPADVDYTRDNIETKTTIKEILQKIADKLECIEEELSELNNHIEDRRS